MVEANLIKQEQLDELLGLQRHNKEKMLLGRMSIDLGLVKEEEFAPFVASYFDVPYINLMEYKKVQWEALNMVPESIAEKFNVLPIEKKDNTLTIAISDPLDIATIDAIETVTKCQIKPVVSSPKHIKYAIFMFYFIL